MNSPLSPSGRRQQPEFTVFIYLLVGVKYQCDNVCRLAAGPLVQINVEEQVQVFSGLNNASTKKRPPVDSQNAHHCVRFFVLVLPANAVPDYDRDGFGAVLTPLNKLELAVPSSQF